MIRSRLVTPLAVTASLLALLAGCSSIERLASGDRIDYRSAATTNAPLEVPPDLTQLTRDPRSQQQPQQGSSVSATTYQAGAAATTSAAVATPVVAPASIEDMRIERGGSQRWLSTRMTPEQLWPQLRTFWQERGFNVNVDEPVAGVMETDWAENRAKLPNDIIRNTLGKIIDSMYSTGERDKFRTRVERTPNGSEVYISHRGMIEVYVGQQRDSTMWQPRPTDPQLEADFLSRLMVKLTTKEKDPKVATTTAPEPVTAPAKARLLTGAPGAAMQLDEGFERAWRRVGLALDRTGFTVEDRDRSGGLYFVRYIDPSQASKDEPGFFGRMWGGMFGGNKAVQNPARYRIAVKASGGESTTVSVLDSQGAPEGSDVGKRIVALLVEDLK